MDTLQPYTGPGRFLFRAAAMLSALVVITGHTALAEPLQEYSVKAAILLNFARFTQWPAGEASAASPVELCVLGDRNLEPAFRKIDGKMVNDRPLRVRFAERAEDVAACDILFVSRGFKEIPPADLLPALGNRPVLTVGERTEFIRSGGMINIFNKNGRVRFEVEPEAVRRHGLTISSRLLNLAIIIRNR